MQNLRCRLYAYGGKWRFSFIASICFVFNPFVSVKTYMLLACVAAWSALIMDLYSFQVHVIGMCVGQNSASIENHVLCYKHTSYNYIIFLLITNCHYSWAQSCSWGSYILRTEKVQLHGNVKFAHHIIDYRTFHNCLH